MPYCFEFKDALDGEIMFLEVVNTCTHHFTGEKMRFVRMHGRYNGGWCSYQFLNEAEWQGVLKNRIMEDTTDTGDKQA